ncbi:MAG: ABC transporter permease [bacterium]|nr:ABC transporter permease [bacterium]MDY4099972.1 ABC transporter permease [Lachnospiraceae bacterium]
MAGKSGREIRAEQPFSLKHLLLRWESMLILLLVAVNIMNIAISDKYWSVTGLFRATNSFLNIAFMVLPMCFVLVLGDIDISVGSILAFSATMLGVTYNAGAPMIVAVLVALLTGTVCGCINGAIATQFTELNPMIITFGTQVVYRGLCEIILGDQSTGGLNNVMWFSNLYWGKIGGVVPYMFVVFVLCAIVFGIVQHKTTFGRRMYAIGANREAARYSGINVQGTRFVVYVVTGLFAGVAAIFTAASMGSINNAVGKGTEMDAIGICVLGGILTDGGKGNFIGAMISVFLLGLLEYGLGLVNVSSNVMLVIKGALLVISVMIPNLKINVKKKKFA